VKDFGAGVIVIVIVVTGGKQSQLSSFDFDWDWEFDNMLPDELRTETYLTKFKSTVKTWVKTNIKYKPP
jgi:hypothetical protein